MYYAIIGRIPGDDEDSCVTCEADSLNEAIEYFEAQMTEDLSDEEKTDVVEQYGELVYVITTLQSESPIT